MGGGGGGRLFEAGRLLTFSAFRMGTYLRWALIRGWALIPINTVCAEWKSIVGLNKRLLKMFGISDSPHKCHTPTICISKVNFSLFIMLSNKN